MLEASLVVFLEWWGVDLNALGLNDSSNLSEKKLVERFSAFAFQCLTYAVLELDEVGWRKGVSLGDNWNEVDTSTQALHDFNVERLKSVASWADEVQAGVDTEIDLV